MLQGEVTMYAATLIDRAMKATGATSQAAFAKLLGVKAPTVSQWRHGTHPLPEERVLQLCEMAGITDTGPWLIAAQADAARSEAVRAALESVLDRLRPALAGVGLVMLGFAAFWTPYPVAAKAKAEAEPKSAMYIMRNWLRRLVAAFATVGRRPRFGYASPVLA